MNFAQFMRLLEGNPCLHPTVVQAGEKRTNHNPGKSGQECIRNLFRVIVA